MRKISQINPRSIVPNWSLNQESGGFYFQQTQYNASYALKSILMLLVMGAV